jgi:hypothetical protein
MAVAIPVGHFTLGSLPMSINRLAVAFAVISVGLLAVGCGGGGVNPDGNSDVADAPLAPDGGPDASVTLPVLRNPVTMPDDDLAQEALRRLGAPIAGADNRCQSCHAITNAHVRSWGVQSDGAYPCLTGVDLTSQASALQAIACLEAQSQWGILEARGLGIWSTAGRLAWFDRLFDVAYGNDSPQYAEFVQLVAMPPSAAAGFDQGELDVVAEWFVRGLPQLDTYLPAVGPGNCTPSIAPEVAIRVNALATTGWRAVNQGASLSMYGCAGASTPLDCMSNQPRAIDRTYSNTWEVAPGQLRLVAELPGYSSSFWTRSSADGRFVAHGGGDGAGGSTIIDLIDDHHIGVDAAYDPAFFPDNSGFVFQGAGRNTCAQSILLGGVTQISMATDPRCASMGIGLYQHLGRAVGGDYFAISGNFVTDNGGIGEDPSAYFSASEFAAVLPMIFNGTTYVQHTPTTISIPFEGDAVISPSTKMMVTRKGDIGGNMTSFVLHALDAVPNGSTYDITIPEIATYCMSGGKPGFSYDERWLVFHHVASPTSDADAMDLGFVDHLDPGYQPYATQGTSNIYLVDLLTGGKERITKMKPGQFAYFPHFRSDGWIYFIERDFARETVVASDAALRAE